MSSLLLSPQEVEAEAASILLERREARRTTIGFTQYTFPQYVADPFHVVIGEMLDAIIAGEVKRGMIFAPPQHGKSELASVRFPARYLGENPDDPVIIASYGANLAHSKSRQVRDIIESREYRSIYGDLSPRDVPVKTRDDQRAVDEWKLASPHRGGLRAAGVGGGLSGHPAALAIIDDPFADWAEAQSPTIRRKVMEWYQSVLRVRVWERGAILIIMTRWHEDDLAGQLLKGQAHKWEVLRLPAIAESQEDRDKNNDYIGLPTGLPDPLGREAGEPLAPNRFSKDALEEIEEDVGSMVWAAEYGQVPRPLEGNRFKRHWFKKVGAVPMNAQFVRYWDKAGTEGAGAFTAGVLLARHEGFTYIVDVIRGQWAAHEREATIKETAEQDRERFGYVKNFVEQEPGSGGKESAESTIRNLAGFPIEKDPVSGNKDVRLEPFAAQAGAGNVFLVEGKWNHDYIEEMVAIPNSKYRDQSDATSGAFNKAAEVEKREYKKVISRVNVRGRG
jgi:predicted phage terminase large subunit-like protein